MKRAWLIALFAIIIYAPATGETQPKKITADSVLQLIEKNFSGVKDYKVDVELSADLESPRVHISKSRATIYFKRPDKVKVTAKEGFALLPEVFPGDPVAAIKQKFKVEYAGSDKIDKEPVHVLKLIPKTTDADGTMKIFVEKRRGLILGTDMQSAQLAIKSRWSYQQVNKKFWLPSKITMEMIGAASSNKVEPSKPGKGTAVINFKNYKVNKGIPDSIFSTKKKGSK